MTPFWVTGAFAGGALGIWLRPAVANGRPLPLEAVLTRGATLRGIDRLLIDTAQSAFNRMLVWVIAGAIIGLLMHLLIRKVR